MITIHYSFAFHNYSSVFPILLRTLFHLYFYFILSFISFYFISFHFISFYFARTTIHAFQTWCDNHLLRPDTVQSQHSTINHSHFQTWCIYHGTRFGPDSRNGLGNNTFKKWYSKYFYGFLFISRCNF